MTRSQRRKLLQILNTLYPNPASELHFRNRYQLLIAVLLSAQCTDKKVNEITPQLFRRYRDFRGLSNASLGDIERIIRPINYYRTKARNLLALSKIISQKFSNKMPRTFEELTSLPGIGRKSADYELAGGINQYFNSLETPDNRKDKFIN